jgi:hypothetical protein
MRRKYTKFIEHFGEGGVFFSADRMRQLSSTGISLRDRFSLRAGEFRRAAALSSADI